MIGKYALGDFSKSALKEKGRKHFLALGEDEEWVHIIVHPVKCRLVMNICPSCAALAQSS
jgi:hypothetical protein